jgi:hypothetical protein
MRRFTCLAVLLSAAATPAFSQPAGEQGASAAVPADGAPPPEAPPSQVPPPPPQVAQPAAPAEAAPQPAASPAGQWVYTSQYGWLWMPYGQPYTYVPGDTQVFPDMYVYYPAYGWRWVVAPWVYGYGPSPYWGGPGVRLYAWYARPWFRVGGYWGWGAYGGWGRYRGWVGPRAWGPRGWAGAPVYYRTGVGGPHPAHFRAEPVRRAAEHERHRGERR